MKLKTIAKSLIALSAAFVLGACGNNASSSQSSQSSQASESGLKTVKIASVGSDADIWRHIAESDKRKSRPKNRSTRINGGVPLKRKRGRWNCGCQTPSNQSATYKDLTKPTQTNSFQLVLRILNQWGFTLKR